MKLESDTKIKDDLGGPISIKFKPGSSFNDYCAKHIENFNADRFEVLAVRFYYGKETAITLYAIDKDRQEGNNFSPDKMPVKKFKLDFQFARDLLPLVEECNFTLTTGNFPLEDMEVINK
jgi:hypothetical protein